MGLTIYSCNSAEALVERLGGYLSDSPTVFESDTVVVQSRPMQSWLNLELARKNGISANVDFPFPNRVVNQLLASVSVSPPDVSNWRWDLFGALASCEEPKVAAYLEGDTSMLKRWSLASRLSDLFDQYQMYRSDEVKSDAFWVSEPWQRELFESICTPSRADLIEQFIQQPPEQVPFKRIFFFGLSYLPPLLLDLLKAVSSRIEICIFIITPGSGRNSSALAERWGREGTEFQAKLTKLADKVIEVDSEVHSDTLLHHLQSSLSRNPVEPCAVDLSLQIISCHSPLREVEVLHQHLLRLFEECPDLEPEDVLITAPNPDVYLAHLQAVSQHTSSYPLPLQRLGAYSGEDSVGHLLLEICDWPLQRLTAVDLLGLCGNRIVQEKFGFDPEDLSVIEELLKESRFCWGLSGSDKEERFGLPSTEAHSLEQGLSRIILGIALDDGDSVYENQILPIAGMTSNRIDAGAKLWALGDAILQTMEEASGFEDLDASGKVRFFRRVLEHFVVETTDTASELAQIDAALAGLQGRLPEKISLPVVRSALQLALTDRRSGQSASLTGGIVVSRMNDIASVPFKVVAILGMNEGAFPSQEPLFSFNLLGNEPRSGDRSRANSDRSVFLQRIHATETTLLLSYCGGSMHRSSKAPPAVPLAELKDWVCSEIAPSFKVAEHPMQPFSPKYFLDEEPFFNYNAADRDMAEQIRSAKPREILRFEEPMVGSKKEPLEVSPQELRAFLMDASKHFVEQVLRVRIPSPEESLPTVEPFSIDGLTKYMVCQKIVMGLMRGDDEEALSANVLADGVLPNGAAGSDLLEETIMPGCRLLYGALKDEPPQGSELLFSEVQLVGGMIRGSVCQYHEDHLVYWRPGGLKPKYLMAAWGEHLLAMRAGIQSPTRLFGLVGNKVEKKQFKALDAGEAEKHLQHIFDAYREGQTKPVALFPKTAWALAESGKPEKAEQEWYNGYFSGEQEDGFNPFIYKGRLPEDWVKWTDNIVEAVVNNLGNLDERI